MIHDAARDYDAVWGILIGWIVATLVLLHVLGRFHKPQASVHPSHGCRHSSAPPAPPSQES